MGAQTPWPADFSELKKLEDILQCPICYEYINTCMITTCSHNFCSLCIRKYLQFKTQCPTCFEETHGSDLRKNRLLDDIINIYVKLKDRLLFTLRLVTMTQSVKGESKLSNGIDSPKITNGTVLSPLKKESKTPKIDAKTPKNERSKKSAVVQKLFSEKKSPPGNDEPKPIVIDGVVIPTMFQPQKSPKKSLIKSSVDMSTCPVCNVDIPLKNVNMHLDSCLAASDPDSSRIKPKPERREPIPKRVYTMMKDKELKKYLKDYGLSSNGDRKAMISRISRYVVLYNAECDKEYPRAVSELVKQIEREEKDEKSSTSNLFQAARPAVVPPEKKKDPEAVEKANKEYLDLNRDNFKKLIEAMRQRDGKNIKPLKPLNRIDSDDEGETKPPMIPDPLPSTSKENCDEETISVYSQDTIADSDSDGDLFEKTPVKVEAQVHHPGSIDWDKTLVKDDSGTESLPPEKENLDAILPLAEDSDSYDSVFNTSSRSVSRTPTNKTPRSARRNTKRKVAEEQSPSTVKIGEKFEEIFDESDGVGGKKAKLSNGDWNTSVTEDEVSVKTELSEEDDDEEEEDDENDDVSSSFGTPVKAYDISPEISPMKTRSAKRKCFTTGEGSATKSRGTRGKRIKPSVSPEF